MHITVLNDASEFVKDSITDVVREMAIAAVLTGMMVLLFLGSWRSTLIIATSIPLAIMTSILMLSWFGQTINVMTLGGLALAVGILVDDATVMIENIAAHLEEGKDLEDAIIDASNQIVIPTLVSTLMHLHRLAAAILAGWADRVPVHAAGDGDRVRDAGVVRAVADARADHGPIGC